MSTEIQKQEVKQVPQSPIDRFKSKVVALFEANNGGLELTRFQNKLIQAYFIKLDSTLKASEIKRMAQAEQYRSEIPCVWNSVNMDKLSQEVIAFAGVGLDPLQKNHINLILYPMKATGLIDVGFIIGYRGKELVAKKYGYDIADNFVIEVVFSNDIFKPFKKDKNNPSACFEFEVPQPFDRGDIIGGFYYHEYKNEPEKNILEFFDMKEIEKRKPKSASAEFWGGTKKVKVWVANPNDPGKKMQVEQDQELDGWREQMVYKTMHLACFGDVVIDSELIDDHLQSIMAIEAEPAPVQETAAESVSSTVNQNANKKTFNFEEAEEVTEQQDPEHQQGNQEQTPVQLEEPEKVDFLAKAGREQVEEPAPAAEAPKTAKRQPSFFAE